MSKERLDKLKERLNKILIQKGIKRPKELKELQGMLIALLSLNQQVLETLDNISKNHPTYNNAVMEQLKVMISELKINRQPFPRRISVDNFPKPKELKFPDEIKVKNLGELKEVAIKKPSWFKDFDFAKLLKIINAAAVDIIKGIARAIVNVVIKNKDPKEAIPVRLVTVNGKEFYQPEMQNVYHVSGGGGGVITNQDILAKYKISDEATHSTDSNIKYYGHMSKDGDFYIMERNRTNGTYQYYKNNTDYPTKWTGREGLTYKRFDEVFN